MVIDIAPADWTPTSSIAVNLVGVDTGIAGPPSISLDLKASDVIFRNGFDN